MWLLISTNDGGNNFCLIAGKEYVVGRKPEDCDIAVLNDQSVSRKHALLSVSHSEANLPHPHKPSILTIKDVSKFGTSVNNTRLRKDQPNILKNGDMVKFGSLQSIYQVKHQPLLMTTSCLDPTMKRTVKSVACRLGSHVLNDWRKECTLLVMNQLSVTVKVICALISRCSVVLPDYLTQLQKAIENVDQLPDPEEYLPPLAESQLDPRNVSFKSNEDRATLFRGKKFIFLSPKQFKKLSLAVELGGGTPVLMEEGSDENNDAVLIQPGTCIMHTDPQDRSMVSSQNAHDWVKHVLQYLAENDKRPIQDAELGYAVLYCSTDNYCNPDAGPGPHLSQTTSGVASQTLPLVNSLSQNTQTTPKNRTVLAADTQSQMTPDTLQQKRHKQKANCSTTVVANSILEHSKMNETSFLNKIIKEEPISQNIPDQPLTDQDIPDQSLMGRKRPRPATDQIEPPSKRPVPLQPSAAIVKAEPEKDTSHNGNNELTNSTEDDRPKHPSATVTVNGKSSVGSTGIKSSKHLSSTEVEEEDKVLPSDDGQNGHQGENNIQGNDLCNRGSRKQNKKYETVKNSATNGEANTNGKIDVDGELDEDVELDEAGELPVNGLAGFLNTSRPPMVSKSLKTEDTGEEEDIPENLVVTEMVSLVVKKGSSRNQQQSSTLPNGTSLWKGKPVKNFKKFRKMANAGSMGFPTIIGGSDLVTYTSNNQVDDVDFGMSQVMGDASQPSQISAASRDDDLFD